MGETDASALEGAGSAATGRPGFLRANEELFENNPFAYFMVRAGGAIVRVNSRFRAATGFATEDLAGKSIEDLLSRNDSQELYGYHREKLRHRDRTFEYECNVTRRDGLEMRAVISMNIVVEGGFGLGALRDVTEERRLSRELHARNQELQQTATMLRAAQEELHHTTQMATLGEVSGRVAHEILNPLTAVTAKVARLDAAAALIAELAGFVRAEARVAAGDSGAALCAVAEALEENNAACERDLAFIASELQRIERLVHDMRGVNRAGSERTEVGLTDLLQYCTEVMSDSIARSRTEYLTRCPDDVYVEVDRGEIVQVLTNLIRNAIEAHDELPADASRRLLVAAEVEREVVAIRVADGGRGVAAEIVPHIFEPSFTTKPAGTGLGLAIARRLVRAHGGDLMLAPGEPGRGATFVVTLPCRIRRPSGWEG